MRASYKVRGGERVEIEIPPVCPSCLEPEDRPLAVLHEDEDLIVLNKPAGIAVHPGAGARTGTLVNALLHHCRSLSVIGGMERPGIVHRLDKDTTGALVVAKNDRAHRALASQFKARKVKKLYEALAWGRPRSREGMIDEPIGRHRTARIKMAIRADGRPARTRYRVVSTHGPVSFIELEPATGRTHQIRVHLMSIRHPVVGDPLYGGQRAVSVGDPLARRLLTSYGGLALHARRLGLTHPVRGCWMEFVAPRPADFEQLLDALQSLPIDSADGARRRS